MPVRGLSPGQLFDSLAQATGADAGEARARFLELFANRDERPTEAQTSILQALTLMNGSYHRRRHQPGDRRRPRGDRQGPVPRHAGPDRDALPRDPDPPARGPTSCRSWSDYIDRRTTADDRAKALADVFWALLNGPEFHLNH